MDNLVAFLATLSASLRLIVFAGLAVATHLLVLLIRLLAGVLTTHVQTRRYQKLRSVATLATSAIVFSLYFFAVGLILREFGVSLTAYLASASVVGLAEIVNAGHFTFSSFCEVDPVLLAFLGGFDEACEPRHQPWRHAQDLTMYLATNFFDGVLNGNGAALARLDPGVVNGFDAEDIIYQSK